MNRLNSLSKDYTRECEIKQISEVLSGNDKYLATAAQGEIKLTGSSV